MQKGQALFLLFLLFAFIFLFPTVAYSDDNLDALSASAEAIELG